MTKPQHITVDGVEFRTADLPQEALDQLEMLMATDAKLKELQRDLAITQTARNAYMGALKALLPEPVAPGASRLNH
mgnify:CR=1 FL=1